jgi:ubiquinone/menaquinone biosynthesis C-methylase UbiE
MSPASDSEYILGTDDGELLRLALQHRVWRPRAADAWRRAGFTAGQTLLDVGCGPGYATTDLLDIVGPSGRVVALDRSERFLQALRSRTELLGQFHLDARRVDLDREERPDITADGAWVRWVFAFLKNRRELVDRLRSALRPGGALVIHEYFHYSTWRLTPRSPAHEYYVQMVMKSWRAEGGEPDTGLELPRWLEESGFQIVELRPIVDVVSPDSYVWQWPKAFIETNVGRLVELGYLTAEEGDAVRSEFAAREASPGSRMITPAVLEIIARRI